MAEEFKKTKEAITGGENPIKETFKIGFMACIESIEDKGNFELAKLLRQEHSQI